MLSESWKILLDYKSERNPVTKHYLNRAWVLLSLASTSKLYAYNTSMANSKFNVSNASTLFFPDFLRAQNMVLVIEGKII